MLAGDPTLCTGKKGWANRQTLLTLGQPPIAAPRPGADPRL
jgi:hypothetical protein